MRKTVWVLGVCLAIGCGTEESVTMEEALMPPFEQFLKIDVHSHIFADSREFVEMMERNQLRIVNVCVVGTDPQRLQLAQERAEQIEQKYPDYFHFASTFDLTQRNERSYVDAVRNWLDRSFEAGAVMTKIWKEVGLEIRHPDGSFVLPDDPLLDPIYAHLALRGKPLLAHLGEPVAAWLPLDPENVHYGYYSNHPEWHFFGRDDIPGHAEIMAARDRMLEKHTDLVVIGAHIGSMAHDVEEVARRLDAYPNFHVEVSARTRDLSRQPPERVRQFFLRYQDRILYGADLTFFPELDENPDREVSEIVRRFEERYRRDYQYYAGSGRVEMAGKEVECLQLPRSVLEKFYHGNARRLIPGLRF